MSQMNRSDLEACLKAFDGTLKESVHPVVRGAALAGDILCSVLGFPWVNQHTLDPATAPVFMRAGATNAADAFKHQDRLLALGELIFNLHRLDGFDSRIALFRAGDVESLLAEFEAAKLLIRAGFPLRFVVPTGLTTADYDMEVVLPSGAVAACEAECKLEETALSRNTIRSTLDHARRQLPRDRPAIVVARIPEAWIHQPPVQATVEGAIEQIFRQSRRLGSVLLHWEQWTVVNGNLATRAIVSRQYLNPNATHSLETLGDVSGSLAAGGAGEWVFLSAVVSDWLKGRAA